MKENEIRPEALMKRYLELSAEDADRCFADVPREAISCVACGGTAIDFQFKKNGQHFLTENRLSRHAWVIGKEPAKETKHA